MREYSTGRNLAVVLAVLLLVHSPAMAAVIVVDGSCTLVDAITAANTDSTTGECPAGAGADDILLTLDVTLTDVDSITVGANGLPSITSNVTIEGVGDSLPRAIVRDLAAPDFRIFDVASTGTLSLENVSVRNGSSVGSFPEGAGGGIRNLGALTLTASGMSDNSANYHGGAIFTADLAGHPTVTLINSTVSNNSTPRSGGGIFNNGTVTLTNSTVLGNTSGPNPIFPGSSRGGGIQNNGPTTILTLTNSTISGNTNNGCCGGGIYNAYGTATLTNSTLSGNSANSGGGIENYYGTLTLTNSTVSGNSATGMYGRGGGIVNSGTATLANSTVSGNSAVLSGGGIYSWSPTVLTGSLVAQSLSGGNCAGTPITDGGNNLADDDTCGSIPDTLTGLDPILMNHGGPTSTHALLASSNAIDLAGNCGLATDQRLAPRDDGDCDAGSFEFGAVPPDQIFTDGFESGDTSAWSSSQ